MIFLYLDYNFVYDLQWDVREDRIQDLKALEKKYKNEYKIFILLVREKRTGYLPPILKLSQYRVIYFTDHPVKNVLRLQLLWNIYPRKRQKYINKKYILYITSDLQRNTAMNKNNIHSYYIPTENFDINQIETFFEITITQIKENQFNDNQWSIQKNIFSRKDIYMNSPIWKNSLSSEQKIRAILLSFVISWTIYMFIAYFILKIGKDCNWTMQILTECNNVYLDSFHPLIQSFVNVFLLILWIWFLTGWIIYWWVFSHIFWENMFLIIDLFHLWIICFIIFSILYFIQKSYWEEIKNLSLDSKDYLTFQEYKNLKLKKGLVILIILIIIVLVTLMSLFSIRQKMNWGGYQEIGNQEIQSALEELEKSQESK